MKLSQCIYLDTAFIIEVFEAIHKSRVPVKVTKTQNITSGLSAGFISGGASASETKEFPLSARQMYAKMRRKLAALPEVEIKTAPPEKLPEYFWATGVFGAAASQTMQGGEVLERESFFRLYSDLTPKRKSVILVTNDVYLATGYDQLSKHLSGSCQGFGVGVRGLFKLLALDPVDAPICAPLVMEKTHNV